MSKTIFLSTVTKEFEPLRRRLAGLANRTKRLHVRHQDDFVNRGVLTLQMLEEEVKRSELVIHVIGGRAGAVPPLDQVEDLLSRHPDFAVRFPDVAAAARNNEVSYTQWEAWLALYLAGPTKPLRLCCYELVESRTGREATQAAHVDRLTQRSVYPKQAAAEADLVDEVVLTLIELDYLTPEEGRRIISLPFLSLGSLFKGREEFLETVRNKLHRGQHVSAIVGAQAVHGLGGLGKTRAAVEYALRHADEYSALFFIAADRPETLEKSLADLCGPLVLNLPEQDVKEQSIRYAAVVTWLYKNPGWFLILDNVDDERAAEAVEGLLPHLRNGHVLITSRFGEWSGSVERLDLEVLTPEASIDFLRERTEGSRRIEPDDESAVAALVQELNGLPLALEQAAAFLVAKQESFAGYLHRWKAHEQKVRTWHDAVRMTYPRSIAVTWDTSFEQLDPSSRALLNMLSWYAPDPIPVAVWQTKRAEQAIADGAGRLTNVALSLRDRKAEDKSDSDNQPDPDDKPGSHPESSDNRLSCRGATGLLEDAEDARAGLSRYGLLQWKPDRSAFSVHRLVQEVTRERLTPAEETASLQDGLWVLDDHLPADLPPDDVRSWPRWNPVRVHVAMLIEHADKHGIADPTSRLMNQLGLLLNAKGLWDEAEKLYRRALAIAEHSYGSEHPNVARHLNNLALLLLATNRLAEAEPLLRRALASDEQSYGAEHPDVAIPLNSLAGLLWTTNRLAEAEPLYRRALAICEQSMGTEHPYVASCLGNIAALLQDTNRLAEAEPLLRRALAIDEQYYGAEHPHVARDLNNLALFLQATNCLAEAEPLMRCALDIFRASLGDEHPNTLTAGRNYDRLLAAMAAGDPAKG